MQVVAGEKLRKNDLLTIDKNNKAVKIKTGQVLIGIAPKNCDLNEIFDVKEYK